MSDRYEGLEHRSDSAEYCSCGRCAQCMDFLYQIQDVRLKHRAYLRTYEEARQGSPADQNLANPATSPNAGAGSKSTGSTQSSELSQSSFESGPQLATSDDSLPEPNRQIGKKSPPIQLRLKNRRATEPTPQPWRPHVTVPQPFQMTLRDEAGQLRRLNHSERHIQEMMREKELEEIRQKTAAFKAKSIPPSTFLPLYEQLVEQAENRRKENRERLKEKSRAQQSPFSFNSRRKMLHLRRAKSMEVFRYPPEDALNFRAQPVPYYILSPEIDHRMKEKEEERKMRIKQRAENMLLNASTPRLLRRISRSSHDLRRCGVEPNYSFTPQVHRKLPNYIKQQEEWEQSLRRARKSNRTTVPEPFILETDLRHNRKGYAPDDLCRAESRPQSGPHYHKTISPSPMRRHASMFEIRQTVASASRAQSIRRKQERENSVPSTSSDPQTRQRVNRWLKQEIKRQNSADSAKIHELREAERRRKMEYEQELEDVKKRLNKRPTIMERQQMLVRTQAAERRYERILKNSGLSAEKIASILSQADAQSLSSDRVESPVARLPPPYPRRKSSGSKVPSAKSSSKIANNAASPTSPDFEGDEEGIMDVGSPGLMETSRSSSPNFGGTYDHESQSSDQDPFSGFGSRGSKDSPMLSAASESFTALKLGQLEDPELEEAASGGSQASSDRNDKQNIDPATANLTGGLQNGASRTNSIYSEHSKAAETFALTNQAAEEGAFIEDEHSYTRKILQGRRPLKEKRESIDAAACEPGPSSDPFFD